MFLVIFEDGDSCTLDDIGDDEISAAKEGFIDIYNISAPKNVIRLGNDGWEPVRHEQP